MAVRHHRVVPVMPSNVVKELPAIQRSIFEGVFHSF